MLRRFASRLVLAALLCAARSACEGVTERAERVSPAGADPLAGPAISGEAFSRALLEETNRVRRAHGRRTLRSRRELIAAADDQAAFMALRGEVGHGSLLRGQATPFDRVLRHGLSVERGTVAENVAGAPLGKTSGAATASDVARMLVQQWMESPGHRATLLDSRVTELGAAIRLAQTVGGGWVAYGAQVFLVSPPRFGRLSTRP